MSYRNLDLQELTVKVQPHKIFHRDDLRSRLLIGLNHLPHKYYAIQEQGIDVLRFRPDELALICPAPTVVG